MIYTIYLIFITAQLWSQPYFDPLQIRYTYALRNNSSKATPFTHLWIGSDLPIPICKDTLYSETNTIQKIDTTILLFSPTFDQWRIDSADKQEIYPVVGSFSFPVALVLPLHRTKFELILAAVPRWNGENLFKENSFQFGGAATISLVLKPHQKYRLGVYANSEFFGLFIVPLFGVDWRLTDKDYLFGILPGRLSFEHQLNDHFFCGTTFRALTNSYRLSNGQFLRLDDNQVSVFLHYYPIKNFCITLEPGYGIFRKIRTGINKKAYLTDNDLGDGIFFKLSGSFRWWP